MKLRLWLAGLTILLTGSPLPAQIAGDAMGVHNLGPGSKSPITGARPDSCAYCHAPHSGQNIGLWNQKLTRQVYSSPYASTTIKNLPAQPLMGSDSNMCLSCHDGTVAVGNTTAYGQVTTQGSMDSRDLIGSSPQYSLQSSHPFSLAMPLKDNVHLAASLASNGTTADPTGAVALIKGNVECTTCHNPHVQAKDIVSQNFLVKDGSNGKLCLSCHDPSRQVSGQVNPLVDWAPSIHATSTDKIAPTANLGSYSTVMGAACITCHTSHNGGGAARLLRGQDDADCLVCHNGSTNVSGMDPSANIAAEYASPKIHHPPPTSTNPHDAAEGVLLVNNRHATCVDCHTPHGSEQVGAFPLPPVIRLSQKDVAGINASDGTSVLAPAVNQYENCLRCHGSGSGKQTDVIYGTHPNRAISTGDPLNEIPQFASTATSSHPVMHPRSSGLPQPSLLSYMLNIDGVKQGRSMGTQILCTDCHNSDDNREFGGSGANGPHGSKYWHILERRYEYNTAVTPGGPVTASSMYPTPDLSVNGPYAMCGKCHNLQTVMQATSWADHAYHINAGFSCSVCHTAHGVPNVSAGGQRLLNFDMNVVAANGGPVSYDSVHDTCNLVCHNATHSASGVTSASKRIGILHK